MGNPRLQTEELEALYDEREWELVKDLPYDAFVIVRVQVTPLGAVAEPRIVASYPDGSKNGQALELATRMRFELVTEAAQKAPSAEIYVVFYQDPHSPRLALVFGRHQDTPPPTRATGHDGMYMVVPY